MDIVKNFTHNRCNIEINYDDSDHSPRENDNISTMACWHTRYNLGDKQISSLNESEIIEAYPDIIAILPLYLYDHSGLTINTTGFSCRWDSGQVGWAFITKDRAEYMGVSEWSKDKLLEAIRAEVKEYDQYLRGEVYGFTVSEPSGKVMESVGGFYSLEDAEAEAKAVAGTYLHNSCSFYPSACVGTFALQSI